MFKRVCVILFGVYIVGVGCWFLGSIGWGIIIGGFLIGFKVWLVLGLGIYRLNIKKKKVLVL